MAMTQHRSAWIGILASFFYGTVSISMTFFNKAVLSVYQFSFPGVLTLLQAVVALLLLQLASGFGFITLPPRSFRLAREMAPLTLCWWIYVISGVSALQYLTVPMFSTLRKTTSLMVLIGESIYLHKSSTPKVWMSVSIMMLGSVLAGFTDLTYHPRGYIYVSICSIFTALYLLLISKIGQQTKLDTFGMLYYNNALSLPLTLSQTVLFSDEFHTIRSFPHLASPRFLSLLIVSLALATILNGSIFLCTQVTSPLVTSVTGQVKDLLTVSLGMILFEDVKISILNSTGLVAALLGSFLFSYAKYEQQVAKSTLAGSTKDEKDGKPRMTQR